MKQKLANRKIGDGEPCFITFEAGPTHSGLESALRLVKIAADAGGDAIKFQLTDADRLVSDKKQLFEFDILVDRDTGETKTIREPLYDILKRRSLTFSEWEEIKNYADSLGISFFATANFFEEIDFLESIGCESIKIASADVNHLPLLKRVAKTNMLIQLDNGNSSLGEIEQAVDYLKRHGSDNILIHQCPSGYPAHLDSININMIKTMKSMFSCPIAFSDHTPGWHMDIAALATGANLLEKTITEDRCTPQVEHIFSLEKGEAISFVQMIRDVEKAMGSYRRPLSLEQIRKRNMVRRSVFLMKSAKAGQKIGDLVLDYCRPGDGISPDRWEELDPNQVLKRDLKEGHKITMSDIS